FGFWCSSHAWRAEKSRRHCYSILKAAEEKMGILNMENIGVVNAEGGPLLLADFRFAQSWHGAEGDSSDYQRACDALDSEPRLEGIEIPISEGRGVLWEMEGAGTADIFRMSENHIAIVR